MLFLVVVIHDDNADRETAEELQLTFIVAKYNSAVIPKIFVLITRTSESHLLGNLQLLHTGRCDIPNQPF